MGNLLFIDSDDINGLSEALKNALERRGISFRRDTTGEFGYPTEDEEEPDIEPYFGIMPRRSQPYKYDENDKWLFQESGGSYGSCGGGCGRATYPRC